MQCTFSDAADTEASAAATAVAANAEGCAGCVVVGVVVVVVTGFDDDDDDDADNNVVDDDDVDNAGNDVDDVDGVDDEEGCAAAVCDDGMGMRVEGSCSTLHCMLQMPWPVWLHSYSAKRPQTLQFGRRAGKRVRARDIY